MIPSWKSISAFMANGFCKPILFTMKIMCNFYNYQCERGIFFYKLLSKIFRRWYSSNLLVRWRGTLLEVLGYLLSPVSNFHCVYASKTAKSLWYNTHRNFTLTLQYRPNVALRSFNALSFEYYHLQIKNSFFRFRQSTLN